MKILVIDNYDSFVYNLVHYLEELDCKVTVVRNDQFILEEVEDYDKILLSPGPGLPEEAGLLKDLIIKYGASKSILGVCLGQQAIGEVYGAELENLDDVFHGVASKLDIIVDDECLYAGLESPIEVGRYHSWVVSRKDFPKELEITAIDENEQIMSLRHRKYNLRGIQFHPESILTPKGKSIIKNWVES